MQLDDMLDNGEPETCSAQSPAARLVQTVKALKNTLMVFLRYANAEIAHHDLDRTICFHRGKLKP